MTKELTTISYETIVQNALRAVVSDVLKLVEHQGLPGENHLYITFQTTFPGVEMADHLRVKHPHDVTIVLQHQFWDLHVSETFFSVGLSFNNVQEKLTVPFNAITGFVDPSVKFGLHFTPMEVEEEEAPPKNAKKSKKPTENISEKAGAKEGKVITLDAFRKKK